MSGSENYAFDGELSFYDPNGIVGRRAAYQGKVTGHGNLKIQWKNSLTATSADANAGAVVKEEKTAFQPLQLLNSLNGKSTIISYAEQPTAAKPVRLRIKLEQSVAKARVSEDLKRELTLLREDTGLRQKNPAKADQILSDADKKLEAALKTLSVETVCYWTADPKSWFPSQMKEETELKYVWDGKPNKEKRVSLTNFLR